MSQPGQFRDDGCISEGYRPDGNRTEGYRPNGVSGDFGGRVETALEQADRGPQARDGGREPIGRDATDREPVGRVAGSRMAGTPLQGTPLGPGQGSGFRSGLGSGIGPGGGPEGSGHGATPPGRALAGPSAAGEDGSAMQRAMGILKQAAPYVARLLPLIEGNLGAAIGNLLSGRPHNAPTQVTVDLAPVKNQLSDLQAQQTELRSTMQEQTAGLKRVEGQLELVREATDRNTLEQQELMGDLKTMGQKVNRVALGLSILLLASIVINLYLYYYIKKVLP